MDVGGHIGLRRNRRTFSDSSISTSLAPEPRWTGHAPTSSADMKMQKKDKLRKVEPDGEERASLTLVGDVKYLGKGSLSDIHEKVVRAESSEQDGERDWNIHVFPPASRYSSGTARSQRIKASTTTPSAHQERPEISRRTLALRAMTLRLIGYILIPVICILPNVIMDLIVKAYPVGDVEIPDAVTGFFDGINGLVGFFNAMLFFFDPVLLVVWAEFRANHHWCLLQKQRRKAQYAEHEVNGATGVDAMAGSPLQDTRDAQVGGVQSTHFGKEDNQPSAKRAFEDSLISGLPLPELDDEQRSPRPNQTDSKRLRFKGIGWGKRREAHNNGGIGLMVHMEVEITKYSDLELVEDYLHGL